MYFNIKTGLIFSLTSFFLLSSSHISLASSWYFAPDTQRPADGYNELSVTYTPKKFDKTYGYYWATQTTFIGDNGTGQGGAFYMGIQPSPKVDGNAVLFSYFGSDVTHTTSCTNNADGGAGTSCGITYPWREDVSYKLKAVITDDPTDVTRQAVTGSITDLSTGIETQIATWSILKTNKGFSGYTASFDEYWPYNNAATRNNPNRGCLPYAAYNVGNTSYKANLTDTTPVTTHLSGTSVDIIGDVCELALKAKDGVGVSNYRYTATLGGYIMEDGVMALSADNKYAWDGGDVGLHYNNAVNGGDGIWNAVGGSPSRGVMGNSNWISTSRSANAIWVDGGDAYFQGAAGTITIDTQYGKISPGSLHFLSDGYVLQGGNLTLAAAGSAVETAAGASATIRSIIDGSGGLNKTGAGQLILTNNNSYAGSTTVSEGTLQLGDGGTTGMVAGAIENNAHLIVNRSDDILLGNDISGTGDVTLNGSGKVAMTSNNSYAGDTNILLGSTLDLGNGGTTGSVVSNIINNGTLTINRSNLYIYSGNVTGTGQFNQAGSGVTVLNGLQVSASKVDVSAGSLILQGANLDAAASGVTVAKGAILGGVGTINGAVNNVGVLTVGNAAGNFNVAPNAAQLFNNLSNNNTVVVTAAPLAQAPQAATGDSPGVLQVQGTLSSSGLVQLAGPVPGNRLIVGSYVGNNATMNMGVTLFDDTSLADRLVIDGGTATGKTTINIVNQSGLGGYTPNGILLVSAINGATTAADAFSLGGVVAAGPYNYNLVRGTRGGSDMESWYLRSEQIVTPPTTDGSTTSNAASRPDYRQEMSLYSTLPQMVQNYGRVSTDNLHEYIGATRSVERSAWMRAFIDHQRRSKNHDGIYNHKGANYKETLEGGQAGISLFRGALLDDGANDNIGINASIGHIHGDVKHHDGSYAGTISGTAYTAAAYWSHASQQGAFIDSIVQYGYYDMHASSSRMSARAPNMHVLSGKTEMGYPIALTDDMSLEPRLAMSVNHSFRKSANDSASDNKIHASTSLTGDIKLRLNKDWLMNDTLSDKAVVTSWVEAGLWREFMGHSKLSAASLDGDVGFVTHADRSVQVELASGASTKLGKNVDVFALAATRFAVSGRNQNYTAKIGAKIPLF